MTEDKELSRFGKFLTAMRLIYQESFDDMANRLGIEPETLSAIEYGTFIPPDLINKIRIVYGLDDAMTKDLEGLAASTDIY